MQRIGIAIATAGLLMSLSARAGECDCEQYRSLVGYSSLGKSVFEIGRQAYDNVGAEFAGDPKRRLIDRLGAESYELIPAACREKLLGGAGRLQLYVRGVLDQSKPYYAADSATPALMLTAYKQLGNVHFDPSVCGKKPTPDCLATAHQAAYGKMASEFTTMSPRAAAARYGGTGGALNGMSASQILVLQAYSGMLAAKDGPSALTYLDTIKGKLTTDQKLTLVQLAGARFNADYDYSRADEGASADGGVNFNRMFKTARIDTRNALPKSSMDFAGVCRDISSAQGQMLQHLGFKNTYVVTESLRSGSMHVTVITQDPEYDSLYRIDYGARRNMSGGDSRALFEGNRDISLNYRVAKPGGAIVADVMSEFGKFMTEAAGFSVLDVDPLSAPHGMMAAGNVDLSRDGSFQGRVGVGTDGVGGTYAFAGVTKRWGEKGLFPGGIGLVLATQAMDGAQVGNGFGGQPTGASVNLDQLYVQLEQRFRTPELALSKNVQARVEAMATAIFSMGRQREGDNSINVQGDLRTGVQARVDQKAWEDRVRATYIIGASVSPGISDIRDVHMPQVPIPVLNNLFFSAEGRMRLSSTPEGRAYLIAATTVLVDELGVRGRAEAGIFGDKVGASVRVEGRLTDDTALFQDGSARTLSASVHWNPHKVVRLSVTGSMPLEKGTTQGYAVMGNISVAH